MDVLKMVVSDKRLPAYSKVIFAYFESISDEKKICSKNRDVIARELNIRMNTLDKNVKKLENYGYVCVYRSLFRTNVYVLKREIDEIPSLTKPKLNWRKFSSDWRKR